MGYPYGASMGRYEVTQIRVEECPVDRTRRHITDLELRGAEGSHRVGVSVARLMLSADDSLVTVSTATGKLADVGKSKCACGYKSIRTVNGSRSDDDMSSLPVFT